MALERTIKERLERSVPGGIEAIPVEEAHGHHLLRHFREKHYDLIVEFSDCDDVVRDSLGNPKKLGQVAEVVTDRVKDMTRYDRISAFARLVDKLKRIYGGDSWVVRKLKINLSGPRLVEGKVAYGVIVN